VAVLARVKVMMSEKFFVTSAMMSPP